MARTNQVRKNGGPARGNAGSMPRFPELSSVALKDPVEVGDKMLPAGARGTVVAAYSDGIAFEVEFFEPFHAVVTLEADNLIA